MSHTSTNESDDGMVLKDHADSPTIDEAGCGGGMGGDTILKKGPWTSAEDAILMDYVKKHGEGNWNAVQKHSGLSRCGKSCRLRWANHLRPNLKKGAFTAEEERLIIELHAKMGNKWARMATHLPGRTDNEIKNYWNTRIKRRQRAGLPLYPPDVYLQTLNEGQQNQNIGEFNSGDLRCHDLMQANSYEIPDVIFDNLKANQGALSYAPTFPNIPVTSMLNQRMGSSQNYGIMAPPIHHVKQFRESETLFPGFLASVTESPSPFDALQNNTRDKVQPTYGLGIPFDPDCNDKNPTPFGGVMMGSHALLNGNFSASKPLPGAVKQELPSLQYSEADLSGWGTSPQLPPPLEAVDSYIQSPPPTVHPQSDCLSPRNSGLLEALIHESQSLSSAKNQSSEKIPNSPIVTPTEVMDESMLNECETEWEDYGDQISPLAHSAASVFSECTPISDKSLGESSTMKAFACPVIKTEPAEHVAAPEVGGDKETTAELDFSRPDDLLSANWFDQSSECANQLAALLSEDLCGDFKHVVPAGTPTFPQGWGLGSCQWNNMPAVCQMSELP